MDIRGHLTLVPLGVQNTFSFISADREDVWTWLFDLLQLLRIRFSPPFSLDVSQNAVRCVLGQENQNTGLKEEEKLRGRKTFTRCV